MSRTLRGTPSDIDIQQHGNIALSSTLFPKLSTLTDDLCVLRSVRSWEAIHERGVFYMQTAHPANPAFLAETPHMGAIISFERSGTGPMPPFLSLNQQGGGFQGSTFLGGEFSPLSAPSGGQLDAIKHDYFGQDSETRFFERFNLLEQLDQRLRTNPPSLEMAAHAAHYESARQMMFNESISAVFELFEGDTERYGDSNIGRAAQVARNAIRARNGTAFIALTHDGWDTHQRMFDRNNNPNMYTLANELDSAIGSLVQDLKASGDLDETLIVMLGEFGRTPGALNVQGGRDHHKEAMSVALFGGVVGGNRVIGATDPSGAAVIEPGWSGGRAIVMEDIAATVYSALGDRLDEEPSRHPLGSQVRIRPLRGHRSLHLSRRGVPMRRLRFGAFLCLLFGFGLRVEAQEFFARDLYAGAERNTIIAGEQIQFWAFALGWDGAVRTDGFEWGSSNEDVATVNPSGLVTGTGIGTTQIWTAVAGRWTQLTIQVLPLRVNIEGAPAEMAPGDTVQLTFVARDINGDPIPGVDFVLNRNGPGVEFVLETSGPHGYYTQTGYINEDGLFYATAEGRVTVWAIINFWGAQAGQTRRFTAAKEIEIKRQPDFRLTRLLAGDPTEGSFKIDAVNWRPFVANNAGQLALVASLGGIADGIVTYYNGNLDLLASTGTPGFFPGSVTREFNNLAMNDRG